MIVHDYYSSCLLHTTHLSIPLGFWRHDALLKSQPLQCKIQHCHGTESGWILTLLHSSGNGEYGHSNRYYPRRLYDQDFWHLCILSKIHVSSLTCVYCFFLFNLSWDSSLDCNIQISFGMESLLQMIPVYGSLPFISEEKMFFWLNDKLISVFNNLLLEKDATTIMTYVISDLNFVAAWMKGLWTVSYDPWVNTEKREGPTGLTTSDATGLCLLDI